ncbi:MAG: GUN4 domain-containing protein [Lyngbya sp. HA4199-MV5]|jgi:hypothetical protein|nr:GUN4 domain-containing protein [Lyngbya sp. HA4199-MV5]
MVDSTGNLIATPLSGDAEAIETLYLQLKATPAKNQVQAIQTLATTAKEAGLAALMRFLADYQSSVTASTLSEEASVPTAESTVSLAIAGTAYQVLFHSDSPDAIAFLQTHFPQGIVPLHSDAGVDYAPLQRLLAEQKFQAADQLTLQKMCEAVGTAAVQRKWLYFTEVDQFPVADLHTLNALWLAHSEGKFGFSVQRDIWLSVGKNWDQLWSKIGWRTGNLWTRYPQEFTWELSAPRGHLPLSNQLRGVRVIASLLAHPAWSKG